MFWLVFPACCVFFAAAKKDAAAAVSLATQADIAEVAVKTTIIMGRCIFAYPG
jgi:hypothetical protein